MHEFDLTNPDERNQAAAEYVLGTLNPAEKARFEALLAFSAEAQQEVEQWREYLDVLNTSLKPVQPSKDVWRQIEAKTKPRTLFWQPWKALAVCSLLLVMSIGLFFNANQQQPNVFIYLVSDEQSKPGWVMRTAFDEQALVMESLRPMPMPDGKYCEVWLMLKGIEPVSLGFLPKEGSRRIAIDPFWAEAMLDSEIVVTIEGAEGAPSGWEMGPVSDRGYWQTQSL